MTVAGAPAAKAARQVGRSEPIVVDRAEPTWASRGGHKLAGALDTLDVVVEGRTCLDAGASTGGFTDVLLHRGAARVVAVDVGYGQLAWHLRTDERVLILDRTNVRHLQPDDVPGPAAGLVVADLSFISLTLVLPALVRIAEPDADHVLLVKPQFEAEAGAVGRGGVVRDPETWRGALLRVATAAEREGLATMAAVASGLPGPSGNIEFFLHLRAGSAPDATEAIAQAVQQGRVLADPCPTDEPR